MSKPSFPTPITPSSTSFSPTKAQLRSSASGSALELLHRSRQRTHAAHVHDLQLLRQMVSVLVHKETVEGEPSDGLSGAGLVEEAQLYAVCMQELCSLVALNAPALAEISGSSHGGSQSASPEGRRSGRGGGPTEKDVLRRECEQLNQHLSQMQKLVGVDDDPEAAWQAFRDVSIKYDRISARLDLLAEAAGAPAGVLIK